VLDTLEDVGEKKERPVVAEHRLVARRVDQPEIVTEWSILWAERGESAAVTRFLESARRCADEHGWLR
jgi:hypothetical protein